MNRLFYRYQVFGYKGAAAQMMDALVKKNLICKMDTIPSQN